MVVASRQNEPRTFIDVEKGTVHQKSFLTTTVTFIKGVYDLFLDWSRDKQFMNTNRKILFMNLSQKRRLIIKITSFLN